jgi:hypothetical protein
MDTESVSSVDVPQHPAVGSLSHLPGRQPVSPVAANQIREERRPNDW